MKKSRRKRKCVICGDNFIPDRFNHHHQKCCTRPECQRQRKRISSKRYRNKKRHSQEFLKAEVDRVTKWRKKNQGHNRKRANREKSGEKTENGHVLRDSAQGENDTENKMLRDVALLQMHCLQGLACNSTGVLRDDIGSLLNHYYDRGKALFPELENQFFKGDFPHDRKDYRSGTP